VLGSDIALWAEAVGVVHIAADLARLQGSG
jgi:hypothetical protein